MCAVKPAYAPYDEILYGKLKILTLTLVPSPLVCEPAEAVAGGVEGGMRGDWEGTGALSILHAEDLTGKRA